MIIRKSSKYTYQLDDRGFTYIEFIIYIALVVLILTTIIPFAWNIIEGGAKSATEQEVFSNSTFISQRINYEIRNAVGINSVSATSISLIASGSANPTVIDVNNGFIRIKQGAASAVNLNSNDTSVSSLVFTNYSSLDNKTKHIQYVFTLSANYGSGAQEYKESTIIEGSSEVRSN